MTVMRRGMAGTDVIERMRYWTLLVAVCMAVSLVAVPPVGNQAAAAGPAGASVSDGVTASGELLTLPVGTIWKYKQGLGYSTGIAASVSASGYHDSTWLSGASGFGTEGYWSVSNTDLPKPLNLWMRLDNVWSAGGVIIWKGQWDNEFAIWVDGVVRQPLVYNRSGAYAELNVGQWAAGLHTIAIYARGDNSYGDGVIGGLFEWPPGVPLEQTFGMGECNCNGVPGRYQFLTGLPVNTATGALTESFTDVELPGVGVPFAFTRAYTSLDTAPGPMGPGWTHPFNASLSVDAAGNARVRAEDGQQARGSTLTVNVVPNGSAGSIAETLIVRGVG